MITREEDIDAHALHRRGLDDLGDSLRQDLRSRHDSTDPSGRLRPALGYVGHAIPLCRRRADHQLACLKAVSD